MEDRKSDQGAWFDPLWKFCKLKGRFGAKRGRLDLRGVGMKTGVVEEIMHIISSKIMHETLIVWEIIIEEM